MPYENATVSFAIAYNWPTGRASFHALQLETATNHNLGIKYRVLAKNEGEEGYRTFDEATRPLSHRELNDIFGRKSGQGIYLTGEEFLVEVCDPEDRVIFGTKVDATQGRWPADARAGEHVISQYFTSPHNHDAVQSGGQR